MHSAALTDGSSDSVQNEITQIDGAPSDKYRTGLYLSAAVLFHFCC